MDVKDVSDEIDTNMENVLDTTINGIFKNKFKVFNNEQIMVGNNNNDENVNKSNIVQYYISLGINANMDTKVKTGHLSQESSGGSEFRGGCKSPGGG